MKKYYLSAIFQLFLYQIHAQGIKGRVTDQDHLPIPSVTIYIEELRTGTTTNLNGEYWLKLPQGKYTLNFKSLGYKAVKKEIEINKKFITDSIFLVPVVYQFKDADIASTGDDPAVVIMRKAIALAPYHLREVKHYESQIYIKGTVYIDKMPKLISKMATFSDGKTEIKVKTGDVYVEESVLDITFNAPRFYKRKVVSLRSSFPGENANPVNPVMIMESSLYEPEIADVISPLSPQAFQHYQFRYEGFSEDNGNVINKIKVIPRRKSQDLYSGYIYIVDGKWCIYSIDLVNVQFWGTLNIKSIFGQVNKTTNTWLPVSYSFNVDAQMMGIKGRYKYITGIKYTNVKMNEELTNSIMTRNKTLNNNPSKTNIGSTIEKEKISRREMKKVSREINQLSASKNKDTLTNEKIKEMTVRVVDSLSKKRDTAYWNDFRPVPLTAEEVKSFEEGPSKVIQKVKKDSVALAQDSNYLKKKHKNPFWIFTGKQFKLDQKKSNIYFGGLIRPDKLSFNTVDGFKYGINLKTWINLDSGRWISIQPEIYYAFSRKSLMWDLQVNYNYKGIFNRWGSIYLHSGASSYDFNGENGIHPFINSVYSLFLRENYMKLYDRKFIEINNKTNINRQLISFLSVNYENITELQNHSNYSFFYKNSRVYTQNEPQNLYYKKLTGEIYRNFAISAGLIITPDHKPKGDGYNRDYNPYPQINITYSMAIPGIFNSNAEYKTIDINIYKRYWLGRNRIFKYQLNSTYWISAKNVFFSNFTSFKTSDLPFTFHSFGNNFQLLPFYDCNTNEWSVDAHTQYQTKLLILKRLPIVSNRIWTENLYFNYLHNSVKKHYMELGYGLGQLWAVGELGVFTSFENFRYKAVGLKFSVAFD